MVSILRHRLWERSSTKIRTAWTCWGSNGSCEAKTKLVHRHGSGKRVQGCEMQSDDPKQQTRIRCWNCNLTVMKHQGAIISWYLQYIVTSWGLKVCTKAPQAKCFDLVLGIQFRVNMLWWGWIPHQPFPRSIRNMHKYNRGHGDRKSRCRTVFQQASGRKMVQDINYISLLHDVRVRDHGHWGSHVNSLMGVSEQGRLPTKWQDKLNLLMAEASLIVPPVFQFVQCYLDVLTS